MSDAKHTPGLWVLRGSAIFADNGRGAHVATCQTGGEDGALLAAAPDLLDALEWMLEEEDVCARCRRAEERCLGHAAVAKARGES